MILLEQLITAAVSVPAPSLGSASISHSAGVCSPFAAASLTVLWSVANPNETLYELHLLENGALVSTQLLAVTSWNKTIDDYVENGSHLPQFTSHWTYTVQIVRKADGVVVDSQAITWAQLYGHCTGAV
jgi:hypothetical protein